MKNKGGMVLGRAPDAYNGFISKTGFQISWLTFQFGEIVDTQFLDKLNDFDHIKEMVTMVGMGVMEGAGW